MGCGARMCLFKGKESKKTITGCDPGTKRNITEDGNVQCVRCDAGTYSEDGKKCKECGSGKVTFYFSLFLLFSIFTSLSAFIFLLSVSSSYSLFYVISF